MTEPESEDSRDASLEQEQLVGETIAGKYLVTRLLGRGGMGAVYEAENTGIGKKVALKVVDRELARDEHVGGRFAREARAASSIESEHIVQVFDAGNEGGRPYIVMELLRGEDLGSRIRKEDRIPLADALHITAQTLSGLSRAHSAGIIHRDLKPDNLFLTQRGQDASFVKIVDFGISKIERAKSGTAPLVLTHKGLVMGTPLYMSPEQAQAFSDVDTRTDLYSVGAILFECITGRPPHPGNSPEQVLLAICMTDAPDVRAIVPSVPEGVADFVAKALSRDRAARFQSAAQMLVALHEIAPQERVRVPLEEADLKALAATVPSTGGVHTAVTWANAPASDASEPPRKRKRFALPLTAFVATLMGVGVTLWILSAMRGNAPAEDTTAQASQTAQAQTAPSANAAPVDTGNRQGAAAVPVTTQVPPEHPSPSTRPPHREHGGKGPRGKPLPALTPDAPASVVPATAGTASPAKPSTDLDLQRDLP